MTDKKQQVIAFFILLSLFLPFVIFGIESPEDIEKVLDNVVGWIYKFFIFATTIFFILAGFTYLTASGDPNKIDKATKMVKFGVIGALVALLSTSVIKLLESLLKTS